MRDRSGFREMVAVNAGRELVWSRVSLEDSRRSGWPYVELLHLAPALASGRGRSLFIGSGGAVGVRQFASTYPGMTIELVERDPAVIELARRWFDLDAIPALSVHVAEGATFIRGAAPGSWYMVVIDAYDAASFATELRGDDFFRTVRRVLRPGGAVACNLIGALDGRDPVASVVASVRDSFDRVRLVPVLDPNEDYSAKTLRNIVVVGTSR